MSKPQEYLCQIDSGVFPVVTTSWSVESPNNMDWTPTVSTAGILSFADTDPNENTPHIAGMNGYQYGISISNAGIVSIDDGGLPLSSSDEVAALVDSSSVTWLLMVNLNFQLVLTTENPLENKYYYPAVTISFTTSEPDDTFELYDVKPNTSMHRR